MVELNQKEIDKLIESGNWMIRFDNDGVSHNDFTWLPLGEWTHAPDWNKKPHCGNGLHGQSPKGHGFCQEGTRLVLCETGIQISIDRDKIKTPSARIISLNDNIPPVFLETVSLKLNNYDHPLPANLASVGGDLYLGGYDHPLPANLASVGGDLYLGGYDHPLPANLASVGGYLYLEGYDHPLPAGLKKKVKVKY